MSGQMFVKQVESNIVRLTQHPGAGIKYNASVVLPAKSKKYK